MLSVRLLQLYEMLSDLIKTVKVYLFKISCSINCSLYPINRTSSIIIKGRLRRLVCCVHKKISCFFLHRKGQSQCCEKPQTKSQIAVLLALLQNCIIPLLLLYLDRVLLSQQIDKAIDGVLTIVSPSDLLHSALIHRLSLPRRLPPHEFKMLLFCK